MKKFVLLCVGYMEPSKEVMEAWMKWFGSISDKIVDNGNPFGQGLEVTKSTTKQLPVDKDAITGYVIINAKDMEEAEKVAKTCPMITALRVYEAMPM